MATINNTALIKELKEGASLQQAVDIIPTQLQNFVQPVMEVNPKLLRKINIVRNFIYGTVGGGEVVYSVPLDRDFFLWGISISGTDTTGASAYLGVQGFVQDDPKYMDPAAMNGPSLLELNIWSETDAIGQAQTTSITFPVPIQMISGRDITLDGGFDTENAVTIYGYECDKLMK